VRHSDRHLEPDDSGSPPASHRADLVSAPPDLCAPVNIRRAGLHDGRSIVELGGHDVERRVVATVLVDLQDHREALASAMEACAERGFANVQRP
jgi:hypothetical protein